MDSCVLTEHRWENLIVTGKDGKQGVVNGENIPLLEQNMMISTVQDITERKHAEEELQERIKELETFYRATLSREGRVIELKQEVNELSEQLGKNKRYGDYSK